MYKDILQKHNEKYDESEDIPPIHTLCQYLREGILGGLDHGLPEDKKAVADIAFSFKNNEMVHFLQKRAKLLNKHDFEGASKIEKEMTELKNDNFDELIQPETFWLTFMHTEAKQSALDKAEFKFENGLSVSVK